MFDHVKPGVTDFAASKAFFLSALEPLGVVVQGEGEPSYGIEISPPGKPSLCLFQTTEKPAHLHIAFVADNRQQVDAFYRAALAAVGRTMARRGCGRTITRITTRRSSSGRMGTISRWCAIRRRGDLRKRVERGDQWSVHLTY